MAARPRFEVRELGPRDFYVHDNVTEFDYDPRFTRKGAQQAADRRNAAPPLVEPRQHDWDDDPRTCALYDRAWDANDNDIHQDED